MTETMRVSFLTIFFFCGALAGGLAQPANDDCENAIAIDDPERYCSDIAAFTTQGATPSSYGPADCFPSAANDVWFTFIPTKTTVTITVIGDERELSGGTLRLPEVALYSGSCGGVIEQLRCGIDETGNNITEITRGGLTVGIPHLIRVQGRNNTGTFQLCINNFNPPIEPGQDCFSAGVLCNKEPFNVESVFGAGDDPTELQDAPCFQNAAGQYESSSVWFSWTAANTGTLTFTLTPNNASDDLDFVVYELPSGPRNCGDKIVIRCMASGATLGNPGRGSCTGATGLNNDSEDIGEPAGCDDRRQDNFLAPLQMEEGKSYALVVNNFTDSRNGFGIEFGGSGEFLGPQADFTTDEPDQTICVGEEITFTDASSFALGAISSWTWSFGPDASTATLEGQGPHTISYSSAGLKSIVLTVESDQGCIVTEIGTVLVECCGDHFSIDGNISNLQCPDDNTGEIDLSVTNPYGPYEFQWTGGRQTRRIDRLERGEYVVTISDMAGCDTTLTFEVESPDTFDVDTLITMPTCNGGTDGAVTLQVEGGTGPYEFDWENTGFDPDNSLNDLSVGDYAVAIRDANNCRIDLTIPVRELQLVLDPMVEAIDSPTCNGFSDGSIVVEIANGLGPFEYDWNDGRGFQDENSLTGIAEGVYEVEVRDANLCQGNFVFNMDDPPALSLDFDPMDASCSGINDGEAAAVVGGGVGGYAYQWSNNRQDSVITDLTAGAYSVTVTDANGCEIEGQVNIDEPISVVIDVIDVVDVICNGESTGSVTVAGNGGTEPFEYSLDGVSFQSSGSFGNLPAGDYTFTVQDARGCSETTQASITEPEALIVDAGEDQTIQLGSNTRLRALSNGTGVSFQWSPGGSLSCTNCPNPSAGPIEETVYVVTAMDEKNCTATDSLTIFIDPNRPVYIPNAFTPDGDGVNDYFTLFGGSAVGEIQRLQVFDRWGELIYEGENIPANVESAGWDGTFRGQEMNNGVFVYFFEVKFIDGKVINYQGDITLLR